MSKIDVSQYLGYYLGQQCQCFWKNEDGSLEYERTAQLVALDTIPGEYRNPVIIQYAIGKEKKNFTRLHYAFDEVKLLLRPLASMSEEEKKECGNLVYDFSGDEELNRWKWQDFETLLDPAQFHYLLSRGFDLFGLIAAGLALDATTINDNTDKG